MQIQFLLDQFVGEDPTLARIRKEAAQLEKEEFLENTEAIFVARSLERPRPKPKNLRN